MTKNYQRNVVDTRALAVPEQVRVAMSEIAADMREGLIALAVGAGLQVMQQLMEADVTAVCGPRGKHDAERVATRHGTEAGSVTLGGRRVPVVRPRVRAVDGTGEVPVPAYELFTSTELLGRMAMERMLAGVSTRRYPVALEPVGEAVTGESRSTSRSAVSRRFVAMTEQALADLLARDLSDLMSEYEGHQVVGIDLHRRRTVLVRTTDAGEVLESVRISNDVDSLSRVLARAAGRGLSRPAAQPTAPPSE